MSVRYYRQLSKKIESEDMKIEKLLSYCKPLNILYVEDNEKIRSNTIGFLSEFFDTIYEASDGRDGLNKYKKITHNSLHEIDIVITDINMPRMGGLEMMDEIKKVNKKQIFLVISAYNDSEYLSKSISIGVDGYLFKPYSHEQFINAISKIVEKITLKRENKEYQLKLEELLIEESQKTKVAIALSESKSKFLASMSHEIRTPLTAVLGYVELLQKMENDVQKSEYIDVIHSSGQSLLSIVNDILDLSKIEAGKLSIDMYHFDCYLEIKKFMKLYIDLAKDKDINFVINVDDSLPQYIYSDLLRIKQITSNLVSNAFKFVDANANIEINVAYENGLLKLSVEDNGIGMTQEQQNSIFEEYTQATTSTTRDYGGTGLGLSIVLNLITLLKGDIKVVSTLGKGTRFDVGIPIEVGQKSEVKSKNIDFDVMFDADVLLAEDNLVNQKLIKKLLNSIGLNVSVSNNGEEAFEMYINGDYELIFMDINMPILSGLESAAKIREFEKQNSITPIPIIALSAGISSEDMDKLQDLNLNGTLFKPIELIKIIELLKLYLPFKSLQPLSEARELGISRDEIFEVMDEFIAIVVDELKIIKHSDKIGDLVALYKAAHSIKGSASLMRFYNIADICDKLEKYGRDGKVKNIKKDIDKLESEINSLL